MENFKSAGLRRWLSILLIIVLVWASCGSLTNVSATENAVGETGITVENEKTEKLPEGTAEPVSETEDTAQAVLEEPSADQDQAVNVTLPETEAVEHSASALPAYSSFWPSFRKDNANMGVVGVKTARSASEVQEKWSTELAKSWTDGSLGAPIIVDDYIYVSVGKRIVKLNRGTGEVVAEGTMAAKTGFFSFSAYGDGMIFVPIGSGMLQAFNADTLEALWQTAPDGNQPIAPVIYDEGRVYMGTSSASGKAGNFFCVDVTDEDPAKTDEVKDYLWNDPDSACYWAGGAIAGNAVLYGNDAGLLQSRDKATGELIDSYQAESNIRCSIVYNRGNSTAYFTAKEAKKVYAIRVNENGSFDKSTVRTGLVNGLTTTSPVVYNGRVYVTAGTMTDSNGGLNVYDAETLDHIYTADLGGISQSSPLLTRAYATEGNKQTVYLYVGLNNANGEMKVIKDFEGNTEPLVESFYIPENKQYCTASFICDAEGTIYYRNDGGYLTALGCEAGVQQAAADRVIAQIDALGQITSWDQKGEVEAARAAFDSLSKEEQILVTNLDKLEAAEAQLEALRPAGGTVTIDVERFTIGQGFYKEPIHLTFYQDETAFDAMKRFIGEENCVIETQYQYLSGIKNADTGEVRVPDYIKTLGGPNTEEAIAFGGNADGTLGQYSYSNEAGWMYYINNADPSKAMTDYDLKDGDVMRIQFSLYGYGVDLSGRPYGETLAEGEQAQTVKIANKDGLLKALADVNSSEKREELLRDKAVKAAYDKAIEVAANMTATQEETDAAAKALADALAAAGSGPEDQKPEEQNKDGQGQVEKDKNVHTGLAGDPMTSGLAAIGLLAVISLAGTLVLKKNS